jgi:alcohol dehydrogenase-like protein
VREPRKTGLFKSGASAAPTGWRWSTLPCRKRGGARCGSARSARVEYTDVVIRRHLYPQTMRRRPPFVLGYDVVGEIDHLGDGVRGFQLGDRVADLTELGSNAAYCTLRTGPPDPRAGGS